MGKGLGAILAANEMSRKASLVSERQAPACPLCGQPMEHELGGWFCRSEDDDYGGQRPCVFRAKKGVEKEFYAQGLGHLSRDDFQGQTLAAIIKDGEPLVELVTIRGRGGRTNLRLWSDISDHDLPELCADGEWTWMDWAYPFRHQG